MIIIVRPVSGCRIAGCARRQKLFMKIPLVLLLPLLLLCTEVDARELLAQAQSEALAEAYQRMNAELQAIGRRHQQQLKAVTDRFRLDMQAATTAEERNAVRQGYQAEVQQLLQATRAETQSVRKTYQQTSAASVQSLAPANPDTPESTSETADRLARQRQMQAELQALGVEYSQRVTALGNEFKQDLQSAASTDERKALQQAYQEKIRALQQEAQAETQAIHQRYQ